MEVKPGYKLTEVGVIPEDWGILPLAVLADVRGGIAKNSNVVTLDPISVHYLRVANVQDGFLDLSDLSKIEINRQDLKHYLLLPGDVLMNEGGDLDKLGRGAIWKGEFQPCVHQNHVFVVRCRSQLSPEYLDVWTGTHSARKFFLLAGKQTTNLASISKSSLGELPVALPPLPEQRTIAAALSDVDALLDGLDRLIAKKRDLKQAAMQQLLTGQTRLPGFSGDWDQVKLDELFSFKNGLNKAKEFFGYGTPIVNYMDVFASSAIYPSKLDGRVSLSNAELKNFDVKKGDVFFTRTSETIEEVGIAAVMLDDPIETVFSGFVLRARPLNERLNDEYKAYCFRSDFVRKQITSKASYTTRALTNGRILSEVILPLPSLVEQTAIAAILSDMDAEITALEARRDKTHALKQGMMQELLTGRIRLVGSFYSQTI